MDVPTDVKLGANVAALRRSLELSQEDVAARMREAGFLYWRQSTVGKTEKGQRALRFTEAIALSSIVSGYVDFFSDPVTALIGDVSINVKENQIRLAEQRLAELRQS